MVISNVQKSGRISGTDPIADARIIDQFMDDVQGLLNVTAGDVTNIFNTIQVIENNSFINRCITTGFTIDPLITVLQNDPDIKDGVQIIIEDTGELLVL